MKWLILFSGVLSNAMASVLVKVAMSPPYSFPSLKEPMAALQNWPFWLGLSLYGVAFLLYAAALARLPLNVAHPILTCGSVALVAMLSIFWFAEPFHWVTGLGVALVICGVFLITTQVS